MSAAIALGIFVIAGYIMARCFDVPVVPSAIGAQLSILVFAPTSFMFELAAVFCIMVGNAVVYAPHMIALGLLARLDPGHAPFRLHDSRHLRIAVLQPLLRSVVEHGPRFWLGGSVRCCHVRPVASEDFPCPMCRTRQLCCSSISQRCSGIHLYFDGVHCTNSVPGQGDRAPTPDFMASELFHSPYAKYFTFFGRWVGCSVLTLTGRARLLVVTGMMSFLLLFGYILLYLLLNVAWQAPLPLYLAHGLFPLFVISAVAGYWGALRAALSVRRGRLRR